VNPLQFCRGFSFLCFLFPLIFLNVRMSLKFLRSKAFDDVGQDFRLVMVQHMTRLNNAFDFNLRDRSESLMVFVQGVLTLPPCIQATFLRLY